MADTGKRQRLRGLRRRDADDNGAVASSKEAAAMAGTQAANFFMPIHILGVCGKRKKP